MPRLGRYIVALPAGRRTKWLVLFAWLIAIVIAVPLSGKLSQVNANGAIVGMPRGAEATQVAELGARFPDQKVSAGILVYVRDSGLTAADRAKVDADRQALAPLA